MTIFLPRLITFEMKMVKEVEELISRIKQGRSTLSRILYMKNLKSKLTGDAGRRSSAHSKNRSNGETKGDRAHLDWDSLMHSANVY